MNYYKLIKLDNPPYLGMQLVARDLDALKKAKLDKDPLVVDENNLPKYNYGVSEKVINAKGVLVDIDPKLLQSEVEKFEEEQKKEQLENIDLETRKAISEGFEFDNHTFSLSANAQLNWSGLFLLSVAGEYQEMEIPTIDNQLYTLKSTKVKAFYKACTGKVIGKLKTGLIQKQSIINPS